MSTSYLHQQDLIDDLLESWINGNHVYVMDKIRSLKNKAQSSFIAASIMQSFYQLELFDEARRFVKFINPNNR